jgi:hypothetical protein
VLGRLGRTADVQVMLDAETQPASGAGTVIAAQRGAGFLVPYLSDLYLNPASSSSTREAIGVVFQSFHRYVGGALGEHLGYMFVGSWVLLASLAMLRTRLFGRWLAYLGIVSAAGILVGLLEPVGFGTAVLINALGFILFTIWLLAIAVRLLFGRSSLKAPSPVREGSKTTTQASLGRRRPG